ncbi:MAG: hypothetical protein RLZ51_374, partial [Pseudomonadota bacterium]
MSGILSDAKTEGASSGDSFAGQAAMSHQHLLGRAEAARQLGGHVDRAMLSAGAADGHRKIAAVFLGIGRQPSLQKVRHMI